MHDRVLLAGQNLGLHLRRLLAIGVAATLIAAVVAGCSGGGGDDDTPESVAAASPLEDRPECADAFAGDAGLLDDAATAYDDYVATNAVVPLYRIDATIEPTTGAVNANVKVALPAAESYDFRVFPGLDSFESGLTVTNVKVNDNASEPVLDQALLTVAGDGDKAVVDMDISYSVTQPVAQSDLMGALDGETLEPAQVGLLALTDTGVQLGHWFPVWLPPSSRHDPDPAGFGDIGAFPAADFCVTVTVPEGYDVITGGTAASDADDAGTVVSTGSGLRDFAVVIDNNLTVIEDTIDDVTVRVWGPGDDPAASQAVLADTVASVEILGDAFGAYPWDELDVVSTPLGAGVGGMEWPGTIWIESSLFTGGIPGLGDLGAMLGGNDPEAIISMMEAILGPETMDALGVGALETMRPWTVAHEVGHEWWHALVGNDSIASPAIDEPLAQYSACVVMRELEPNDWERICDSQTTATFSQAMMLGLSDAPANQASDAFDSALQYGAVIYGKAPGFYFATAELLGWDEFNAILGDFVSENAFALVGPDALRTYLVEHAGDQGAEVDALWQRWIEEAHGAEDIEPIDPAVAEMLGDADIGSLLDGLGG